MTRLDLRSSSWNRYSECALWFNAFWAAMGNWYLLGRSEPMPMVYLNESPFSNYDGPGLILLLVVGGSSMVAAFARWRDWRSEYLLRLAAGFILPGWLLFEFLWVPVGWIAQPNFAIVAAMIIVGGNLEWRRDLAS